MSRDPPVSLADAYAPTASRTKRRAGVNTGRSLFQQLERGIEEFLSVGVPFGLHPLDPLSPQRFARDLPPFLQLFGRQDIFRYLIGSRLRALNDSLFSRIGEIA